MAGRKRSRKTAAQATTSAAHLSAVMMGAPFVISTRLGQMWMGGVLPSSCGQAEATRMVTEKAQAMVESAAAVGAALTKIAIDGTTAAMTGSIRSAQHDAETLLAAALKPYATRVTANHKRLLG